MSLQGLERAAFRLDTPEGSCRIELGLPGLYNVYNAVAAAALARTLGAALDEIAAGLGRFSAAFGRFERIAVGGKRILLLLIKNPAGANEAVRTLVDGGAPRRSSSSRSTTRSPTGATSRGSGTWTSNHSCRALETLVASGGRAAELALRFRYGGLDRDAIEVEPDLGRALDRGLELTPEGGELVVLPTYTAMLGLQRLLASRGLAKPYWEQSAVTAIRVGHLYPDYLNIYADRGNIAVLTRRAAWRGHELEVTALGMGDAIAPGEHDLYYVGGGQDREQLLVAEDLARKAEPLHEAVDRRGGALLAVCGGYQLLGRGYRGFHGEDMPGIGLLPLETVAGERRMIGDVLIECELEPGEKRTLAGFENHAGRTRLDPGAEPLGRVLAGFGNDGESGFEGCRAGRVIGTYLHGPLLPRNAVARRLAPRAGARAPARHRRGSPARAAARRARAPRPRGIRRSCPLPRRPLRRLTGLRDLQHLLDSDAQRLRHLAVAAVALPCLLRLAAAGARSQRRRPSRSPASARLSAGCRRPRGSVG